MSEQTYLVRLFVQGSRSNQEASGTGGRVSGAGV